MQLYDNHHRPINYLRLAVTDRCNLRCFYCMPEQGIRYLPKKDLLTFQEIERLIALLAGMGISKVRLTGGEPFVRNDLMDLIRMITGTPGIHDLHLTTNGILTGPHVTDLKKLGIASVNLSLDTLDPERYRIITRKDSFAKTWDTFESLIAHNIPMKLNAVVMEGKNIADILPLVALTRDYPISVRFIEEMPFNGEGEHNATTRWTWSDIFDHIKVAYPELAKIQDPVNATAMQYQVPGYSGTIGIIAAYSRTFCGTCNRIRVTAKGILKTCLYDDGVMNLGELIRSGASDEVLKQKLLAGFGSRPATGFEAEQKRRNGAPVKESMSTIGG